MFSFKIWYSCNLTNFSQNISDYTFDNVGTSNFKNLLYWKNFKTILKLIENIY